MATKYTLTTAFTTITETSGTIQNVGAESVELASSTNAVAGEGIVLNPSEKRSFKGALSARSIGDAGAVVNVVDFTEAGEGGEEYVLPVASDTTLGGVKISNSFTVANDGTLNIKKAGKTILGAVKSSDDEGKVTVNNDATMTYNPLGYRQPSTTYEVGDIAYHASLPTGYYLECTTAGTTGSGALTISSPTADQTITDGTVVWLIQLMQASVTKSLSVATDLDLILPNKFAFGAEGYTLNTPTTTERGRYNIINMQYSGYSSQLAIQSDIQAASQNIYFRCKATTSEWNDWQQLDAIVAKSFSGNGYVKYASGLIVQWGVVPQKTITTANTAYQINFPISFTQEARVVVSGNDCYAMTSGVEKNTFSVKIDVANRPLFWIAIGY